MALNFIFLIADACYKYKFVTDMLTSTCNNNVSCLQFVIAVLKSEQSRNKCHDALNV